MPGRASEDGAGEDRPDQTSGTGVDTSLSGERSTGRCKAAGTQRPGHRRIQGENTVQEPAGGRFGGDFCRDLRNTG